MQHGSNTDLCMTSRIVNDISVTYNYVRHKHFYYNTNIVIIVIRYIIYKSWTSPRFACYDFKAINSVQGNFVIKGFSEIKGGTYIYNQNLAMRHSWDKD